jgi:TP901 family phage tail tape measure protein
MAGNNDLVIKIVGSLNQEATKTEINTALGKIESKISKLKLSIDLDDRTTKTLADFAKAMENHKAIAKDLNKVMREEKEIFKDVNGVTKELTKQYLKSGEVIEKVRTITDKRTKATQNETKAVGQLIDATQKLGQKQKEVQKFDGKGNLTGGSQTFKDGSTDRTYTFNKDRRLTGTNVADNSGKNLDKTREALTKLYDQGKITEDIFKKFNTSIDGARNANEIDKVRQSFANLTREVDNKELQKKITNNAQTLLKTHKNTVNSSGVNDIISSVSKIDPTAKNASNGLKQLEAQLNNYKLSAKEASRMSLSFVDQLKIAMARVPLWAASTSIFYGAIHGLQSASAIIVEIDGQMTELKKVMDEETNFDRMLQSSIENADKFAVAIQDINTAMAGFAKMGFSEKEVIDLSGTTAALQQISDLTAEDAMDTLASAMVQWNMTASESIKIADMLNEVDNRNSVSVVQLADSMSKAGDTASTYGASLERLLGYTTAIATTTRESGKVIGNGLKSIFSRLGSDDSIEALGGIGVAVKQADGSLRSIDDILDDVSEKWDSLNNAQQRQIGLATAGTYQLTRWNALMANYGIAVKASGEALNSEGSAMSEVAKRSDSLEAKIVRMKNSWTELSLAMGDSVLTNSLIGLMTALTNMANFGVKVTNSIGLLPVVLGTVVTAFLLTNKSIKNFIIHSKIGGVEVKSFSQGLIQLRASAVAAGTGMLTTTRAMNGLKIAMRGLLASTVIGAALVAVGWGIEKLISSIAKSKKEARDLQKEQDAIAKSYGTQRDVVDSLLSKHKELSAIKKRSTEQEQEYLDVSTQLSRLMPNLVDHIDSYGQAHIKTGEALQIELKYARELVELAKMQIAETYTEKFDKSVKNRTEALNNLIGVQRQLKEASSPKSDYTYDKGGGYNPDELSEEDKKKLAMNLRSMQRDVANANLLIRDNVGQMITEILKLNNVEIDDTMIKQIDEIVKSFDVQDLNAEELAKKAQDFSNAIGDMQKKFNTTNGMQFQTAVEDVKALAIGLGYTEKQAEAFVKMLMEQLQTQADVNEVTQEAIVDQEALTKAYEDAVSAISSLNGIMNELNDKQGVSAESIQLLMEKYPDLLQYINDEKTLRIKLQEQIEKEAEVARQAMLDKMSDNTSFYNAMLKNNSTMVNQFATDYGIDLKNFTSLAKAKAEVDNEVRSRMSTAWNDYYQNLMKKANGTLSISVDGQAPLAVKLGYGSEGAKGTPFYDAFKDAEKISSDFTAMTSGYVKSLTGSIPKIGLDDPEDKKDSKKDSKDRNSKRPEAPVSVYTSSKFEKDQTKYNDQLDESEHKLSKLKDTSEEYRKELEKQKPIIKNLMTVNDTEQKRLAERNQKISSIISGMGDPTKLNNEKKGLYNELKKEFDENQKTITSLTGANRDFQASIDQINTDIAQSKLAELAESQEKAAKKIEQVMKNFAATQAKFDKQIIDSQRRQSMYEVGSKDWEAELKLQNDIHKKKMEFTLLEREELKKALRTENLSAEEKANLKKRVDELSISYGELSDEIRDNNQALIDAKEEQADKIIETVKKAIETERDLKLAAIDDEIDALEKAYQKKVALLDKEEAARDHNKELSKMQKEQLSLQTQISRLSLDDSQEAKAKRLELQKQLAELMEQIDEKQHDRSLELQKEGLQDSYDAEKDGLDEQRRLTDRKYSEMLNDERYFAKLREDIIAGNLDNIQTLLGGFLTEFQSVNEKVAEEIGISWQGLLNIIEAVKNAQSELGSSAPTAGSGGTPSSPSTGGNTGGSGNSSTGKKGRLVTGTFKNGLDASELADILQLQYGADAKLAEDNGLYRVEAEFSSYQNAEKVLARLIERKLIGTGRVEKFHEGGIVGGKGSRLAELANKMFNLNSGETYIKSLNGELQIPPKNIPNIFSSIGNMITGLIPKQTASSGGMSFENLVHIENFNGTRAEIDNLGNALVNKLKNKGVL